MHPPRRRFAQMRRRKANHTSRPYETRRNRRLQESLHVDRNVVPATTQFAAHSPSLYTRSGERNSPVDDRHELDQLSEPLLNQPVNLRVWKRPTERRHDRKGVNEVPERTQSNHKYPHARVYDEGQWPGLLVKTVPDRATAPGCGQGGPVVEWLLGSPMLHSSSSETVAVPRFMTTRPPA